MFNHYDFIVSYIDIDKDNNSADVYIEVSSTGTYTIDWIESIIKKIKAIQDDLVKAGLIDDISLGDIYKGVWRISINFNVHNLDKLRHIIENEVIICQEEYITKHK